MATVSIGSVFASERFLDHVGGSKNSTEPGPDSEAGLVTARGQKVPGDSENSPGGTPKGKSNTGHRQMTSDDRK